MIDNWMISLGGLLLLAALVGGAFGVYRAAKRGMQRHYVWSLWTLLIGTGAAMIGASFLEPLDSGPAELISLVGGGALIALGSTLPLVNRRVRKSEENRMIAKDL